MMHGHEREVEATTREVRPMAKKLRKLHGLLAANEAVRVPGASMVSQTKAREIVSDGTVHGKPLTGPQKRLFQGIAHGWRPTRMR